ncbi:MAG: S41 family peptidase [Bacteroidales bacterium]|jgi:hypothetical protein|nr:S41 family peptidase [Bacteroidota bacterium]HHW59935.1 hypothetical protein [Bacteroidales bacterium]
MKSFIKIFSLFLIFISWDATAQDYKDYKMSKHEAYIDLAHLYQYLCNAHPNISEVADTVFLKNAFANLFFSIDDSVSINEFFVRLAYIFSKIDDSHLMLNLNYYAAQKVFPKFFGGVVAFNDGKIYLLKDVSNNKFFNNTRILSINDIDASEIYSTLANLCNADLGLRTTKDNNASLLFYYYFPFIYQVKNINNCVLLDEINNDTIKYIIDGISMRDIKSSQSFFAPYIEDLSNPYKFKLYPTINMGYLYVSDFLNNKYNTPDQLMPIVISNLNKYNISYLILDLRGNPGGYVKVAEDFLKYLMPAPFTYVKTYRVNPSKWTDQLLLKNSLLQKEWYNFILTLKSIKNKELKLLKAGYKGPSVYEINKETKPHKNHFNGTIYVLTDGGSISASSLAANLLAHRPNTYLVGLPPGGTKKGTFGQSKIFLLPHSHISVSLSLLEFVQFPEYDREPIDIHYPLEWAQPNFNDPIKDPWVQFVIKNWFYNG